jgi:osmoprotectant transport system ATP-binding protein
MLEFRNVSVTTAAGRPVLQNISLSLEEGTVTAILGRSGSGKTTLLRTANRMIVPSQGQICFEASNIAEISLVDLRRRMGYVIQETGLFPHFNIERNVGIILEALGLLERHFRTPGADGVLQ